MFIEVNLLKHKASDTVSGPSEAALAATVTSSASPIKNIREQDMTSLDFEDQHQGVNLSRPGSLIVIFVRRELKQRD